MNDILHDLRRMKDGEDLSPEEYAKVIDSLRVSRNASPKAAAKKPRKEPIDLDSLFDK